MTLSQMNLASLKTVKFSSIIQFVNIDMALKCRSWLNEWREK